VRRGVALALSVGAAARLLTGCGGGGNGDGGATASPKSSVSTTPTTVVGTAPTTGAPTIVPITAMPEFTAVVAPVTATELGASWREGCPVGPEQLRRITLSYWDFDGVARSGALVVHADVADVVTTIFHRLFDQRVAIRRIEPVDRYAGSDDASMAADNTSAFNCRRAVTSGPAQWSAHAFGRAIDVNPVENPYVLGGEVLPPEGAPYVDRANVRPGMAVPGSAMVEAFAASGWQWGGRWTGSPDYQHFSADGS
jgi:hypothetical protein